jgi:hypothetical protein
MVCSSVKTHAMINGSEGNRIEIGLSRANSGKSLMGKAQIAEGSLLFLPTWGNLGMLGAEVERK